MKTICQQLNIKQFPFEIKDSNGNTIYFETSYGFWWKGEYDSNGNQIYFENSDGDWCKYEYDSKENQIYYEDSDGKIEDKRPKTQDTKQQTVVEWLVDKFSKHYAIHQLEDEINQAKQMFEQQIIQAYNQDLYGGLSGGKKFDDGKHYYNETFKSK